MTVCDQARYGAREYECPVKVSESHSFVGFGQRVGHDGVCVSMSQSMFRLEPIHDLHVLQVCSLSNQA